MNLNDIFIIKNNGTKEKYNADKINSHLGFACEGLDVDPVQIIRDARLKLYDGVKSLDIQNSLIKSAAEKISEDKPDYEICAGRLLNQMLRKEVYKQYKPLPFKDVVKERINKGFYTTDLNVYTDEELEYFGSKIEYELDNNLPYSALVQLKAKYLIKYKGNAIETPQEVYMLIPMSVFAHEEPEIRKLYVELGYELLSKKKISLPTPIMNGARTNHKSYISCNVIDSGDSAISLSKTMEAVMMCTANKAGLGINVSKIRGLGASVGNPEKLKHTGVLPIIKTIEAATGSLTQVSRSGSVTLTMPFYHYEIELFSQLGDSKGSLENRARHTDQSIIINKWFLRKALNKEDIYLFHMNNVPDLYDALGYEDKFEELYNKYAKEVPEDHKKKVNAWNLLTLIINERLITGRVYFVFADNFVNTAFKKNIYNSNLCSEISLPQSPLDGSEGHPEIACCILSNMNLGYTKLDEIPSVAKFLVRFLDNLIDISTFNMEAVEYAARKRRTLGIGISNLFGYLARSKQFYNVESTREDIHNIIEAFYYNIVKASVELAKERGKCELFEDTIYSEGKFIHERYEPKFSLKQDWETLRKDLLQYGMRNSTTMAVPPAATSSVPSSATPGVEPPRELVTSQTDKHTTIKRLVPFYKSSRNYYTTAWGMDFNNTDYLKLISTIQPFIDQTISINTYHNTLRDSSRKIRMKDVVDDMINSFNMGICTWYYANFLNNEDEDGLSDKQEGCESGGCSV